MKVTEGCEEGIRTIVVQGELDREDIALLTAAIDAAVVHRGPLLFDFTRVSYIDSAGLAALFYALSCLSQRDWLGILNMSPFVERIVCLAGLDREPRVRIFKSRAELHPTSDCLDLGERD